MSFAKQSEMLPMLPNKNQNFMFLKYSLCGPSKGDLIVQIFPLTKGRYCS